MEQNYKNARENNGYYTYTTGLTVYEEQFHRGMLYPAGWNGMGASQSLNGDQSTYLKLNPQSRIGSFGADINGISQPDTWTAEPLKAETKTLENGTEVLECRLTLNNTIFPLSVTVVTVLDGTAVFERKLEWTNLGSEPLNLSRINLMGGPMEQTDLEGTEYAEKPEELYSLGYFASADWGREGAFKRRFLPPDETSFSGRFRRSRHRHPMFLLNNRLMGTVFYAQLGYWGGYTMSFDYRPTEKDADLQFEILLDGGQPLLVLRPGEIFTTPSVHIGMMNGSDDEIIQQMHEHSRRTVFTLPEAGNAKRGGLVISGVGPEAEVDFPTVKRMVDQSAAVGVELAIVDAGWFCPPGTAFKEWRPRVGNWHPDPTYYPDGLKPVADYIHSKGMMFGLWVDIERIGLKSEIRAQHPDWVVHPYGDHGSDRIDLMNPEAAAWMENELARIFTEYQLDLFRLDSNIYSYEIDAPGESREDTALRSGAALIAMYERLRRRFPNVVFENCAGGGGRTDLDFVRNFTHTWVSDTQRAPLGMEITNGLTMVLPPERIDRMFPGQEAYRDGRWDLTCRHTLFGRPTVNIIARDPHDPDPILLEHYKHTLDLYKDRVRPWAAESLIWHHTPEIYGKTPCGNLILERSSPDGKNGILGLFALCGTAERAVTVHPRGLKASLNYEVIFDNSGETLILTGYEMQRDGLRLTVPNALSSELVLYRAL